MRKFFWLLLVFTVTWLQAQDVRKITDRFLNDPAVARAWKGVHVVELESGKEVAAENKDKLFVPASTLKTIYTFAALDRYGDLFTWKTELLLHGKVRSDTLKGNIIIRSWGDPVFGGGADPKPFKELLDEMMRAVWSAGIKHIDGNIELQMLSNPYPAHGSWPIEDIGNYYGTGYWGFNFNDNTYKLYLQTGEPGEVPQIVKTEPEIPQLHIYNLAQTAPAGSDDTAYLYGDPTSFTRTLIGQIPQTDSLYVLKGGIPYPPLTFIMIFKERLGDYGIGFSGKWFVRPGHYPYEGEQTFWTHVSPPLIQIAKYTLNHSVNMYSEALTRWTVENGAPASDRYLNKDSLNAYFRQKGFRLIDLEDGSGLAPDNLIAPSEFTSFWRRRVQQDGLERVLDILPHGGEEGYAKYFLAGSPVRDRVWVKSGSVSKVRNYTGIFRAQSGKYYAFAVMVNHFDTSHKEVKKAIEKYVESLIKAL